LLEREFFQVAGSIHFTARVGWQVDIEMPLEDVAD
jgi:hypothetical protein